MMTEWLPSTGHLIIRIPGGRSAGVARHLGDATLVESWDGQTLTRDDLETLLRQRSWKQTGATAVVIAQADLLSPLVQAGLLKAVEESADDLRYVFCVTTPDRLSAPLRSRCLLVHAPAELFEESSDATEEGKVTAEELSELLRGPLGSLFAWSAELEPSARAGVMQLTDQLVKRSLEQRQQAPSTDVIRAWERARRRCADFPSRATLEAFFLATRPLIGAIS